MIYDVTSQHFKSYLSTSGASSNTKYALPETDQGAECGVCSTNLHRLRYHMTGVK